MTKRKATTSTIVSKYHDKYDLLRDSLERELMPLLPTDGPVNVADRQIIELARDIVTCLRVRRAELTGYPVEGERDS